MTPGELYADVRLRIDELVRDLPEEQAKRPVPGCPGWTVHDVVAHATGIAADLNAGNVDGAATDPWTQAQVDARREAKTNDVLDEWAREAVAFGSMLDGAPKGLSRTLTIDLVTHEHDIRGALGVPGGRDCEAYVVARKGFAVGLSYALKERGLPALRLEAPDFEFETAEDPPVTVRVADSFELFRALAGRRGRRQVLAYDWSGDPEPYLPVLNHFGPLPDDDVIEG